MVSNPCMKSFTLSITWYSISVIATVYDNFICKNKDYFRLSEISSCIGNGKVDTASGIESITVIISLHVALVSAANHIYNILLQHLNELAGKLDSIP